MKQILFKFTSNENEINKNLIKIKNEMKNHLKMK